MKWIFGTLALVAWFAFWFTIFAGNFRTYAEPVVVPHCVDPTRGWFLPCFDIDRYEYT